MARCGGARSARLFSRHGARGSRRAAPRAVRGLARALARRRRSARRFGVVSSATRSPPLCSIRPASSSSTRAARIRRTSALAARASSSIDTGAGPSRAATRAPMAVSPELPRRLSSPPGSARVVGSSSHRSSLGAAAPPCVRSRRGRARAMVRRAEHVFDARAQVRAVAQQVVGSFGARIERRAGRGEDLAPLLGGEAGGDQRAGAARRLDHDRRRARGRRRCGCGAGSRARAAPMPSGISETIAPFSAIARQQRLGLGRIGPGVAAGEHGDRCRSRAPRRWARWSMPRARPETTT